MGTSGRPDHMVQPVPDRHVRRVTELSIPVTPEVAVCGVWPLRSQCVAAKPGTGRTVQLHPQEALLQQARALQQSEAFAEYRQRRVVVEHRMATAYAIEGLGLSERRACLLTGVSPSVYRYRPERGDDDALRRRMRELAGERKRFGSPRLHIMLKREGLVVNHKRTERIYNEEGLALRRKRRRKGAAGVRVTTPSPVRPNQKWSMDFVTDTTVAGRRFRALAIVDDYSRECPAIEVDTSLGGARVVGVLERLRETRGLPESITVDNGPEFAGKAMDEWAYRRGIKLNFIRPGKPVENAFAESFNGRLRDECLNTNWFMSVRHAREIIEDWRLDYNEVRPHSSLKGKTPKEFIEAVAGLY